MPEQAGAEWPITEVAALSGVTSRTLRHYGEIGLLAPSRTGANGMRYYDLDGLVRLQRILLLRQLGLGLPAIADVLARHTDAAAALEQLRAGLSAEQRRITRQLASVTRTLDAIRHGKGLEMSEMFDGFDHTRYREEVEQRWGAAAYAEGDRWWTAKSPEQQTAFRAALAERNRAWVELAAAGAPADGTAAQALARAHVEWLRSIPGTPAASGDPAQLRQYVLGLAELYVADERFAANYAGADGAAFVRAALEHYATTQL